MKRSLAVLLVLTVVVLVGGGLILLRLTVWQQGSQLTLGDPPSKPTLPSVAVVALGSKDSYPLALGFAQALADRLHCAPEGLTQQFKDFEVHCLLRDKGFSPRASRDLSDGRKLPGLLGVDCAVGLTLRTAGGRVQLDAIICRAGEKGKPPALNLTGTKKQLAGMQTQVATRVAEIMELPQGGDLKTPNFNNPDALEFYGRSRIAGTMAQAESFRKKMLDSDRESLFALVRFVDFYAHWPADCLDIDRSGAAGILAQAESKWSDNSLVMGLKAPLLVRLYRYAEAQDAAAKLVRSDRDFAPGYAELAAVARRRGDAELAVRAGHWAIALSPKNPYCHAALARGYILTGHNLRRGQFYPDMSAETREKWQKAMASSVNQAGEAVKLDPGCGPAWRALIVAGRELGEDVGVKNAFRAARASDPNDLSAYIEYGFANSPKWGGSRQAMTAVVDLARKRFGRRSKEAYVVQSGVMWNYVFSSETTLGGRYEEDMLLPCSWRDRIKADLEQSLMLVECRYYLASKQRPAFYQSAKRGFEKWRSHIWRYLYGSGCEIRYEREHDGAALETARQHFATLAGEIPYDPRGWIQWGWCLSHLGNREEAKEKFLKALELDPQNELARQKLKFVE